MLERIVVNLFKARYQIRCRAPRWSQQHQYYLPSVMDCCFVCESTVPSCDSPTGDDESSPGLDFLLSLSSWKQLQMNLK